MIDCRISNIYLEGSIYLKLIYKGGTDMGKYKELAEKILIYMGGAENISKVAHCATRLRLTYKDKNKIGHTQ